jgi:hypothetical protein
MIDATLKQQTSETSPQLSRCSINSWESTSAKFLDAIPTHQRERVQRVLETVNAGGSGLRDWVSSIAYRKAAMPKSIPAEVIDIYLKDSEAVPLHDCEHCGFAVPVRPNRLHGMETDPEIQYFPNCPICDGKTGPYYYWSGHSMRNSTAADFRPKKPR